ncbi:MFS transporter [Arthrobacter sp. H16F315]|uniref:MFS transporter n=1 Tax=Arthrobacter sp. H16F315 TaxID=2955314 RepID=UPI0021E66A86|nr:MFS transporter [Arthrobacter sp. H16F315]MDD1478736.1 MFS transporter [Arthrobacter sp. H16F315]
MIPPQKKGSGARRAALGSFIGTTVEWYDFYVYSTAAALVFGTVFFPDTGDRLTGIVASFATLAVGFFARPLGGIVFGHIGDRFGRKNTLVITLTMMGIATLLIGFLPTYAQVGSLAPVLLVILRFIQGLAVGGEWGGAVLMAVEHAPEEKKTFYGGIVQAGNPAGALLATGAFSILTLNGKEFLLEWGWRLPFLASALLILVGILIRIGVQESPVYEKAERSNATGQQKSPLREAVGKNWRTDPPGDWNSAGGYRWLIPCNYLRYGICHRTGDRCLRDIDPERTVCRLPC